MSAIVLASASVTRGRLLRNAGLDFTVQPARVDEESIKTGMHGEGAKPIDAAQALADLKAARVSPNWPDAFVVGADQILECDGVWFDKPESMSAAHSQLASLSGRTHHLHTAATVAKDGAVIWRESAQATLRMRTLSDATIATYLTAAGESVLESVGAYQIEGHGIQLFAAVQGDFFSILGLPLLSLLNFLRGHGVVPA
ncbi:MAG: Maf family protein [Alphaproteobacteria bacterium]|nr:Maf family protein [Alphaproteobacteria bacterium]